MEVDTTLLIHPRAMTDFIDFHFFLTEADAAIRNLGQEGSLQIASFHPAYEFAGSAPDDVANCTNRSPHPMLHLLREASIDRAVAAYPDAAAIYERNIETLRRLGQDGWRRLWTPDPDERTNPRSGQQIHSPPPACAPAESWPTCGSAQTRQGIRHISPGVPTYPRKFNARSMVMSIGAPNEACIAFTRRTVVRYGRSGLRI